MSELIINRCLDLLKSEMVQSKLKTSLMPIAAIILSEIYPYLYIIFLAIGIIIALIVILIILLISLLRLKCTLNAHAYIPIDV